jgi:thioredoxin 1
LTSDRIPPIVLLLIFWRINVSEAVLQVGDSDFNEKVVKADGPVLVDYWAPWCGPCKMISPLLEEVAKEFAGKLTVVKLNIDDNPQTPQHYGVRGIPTLMIFKNGEVEATKVGAITKSQLSEFITSNS